MDNFDLYDVDVDYDDLELEKALEDLDLPDPDWVPGQADPWLLDADY